MRAPSPDLAAGVGLMALVSGCSEFDLRHEQPPVTAGEPAILVEPEGLLFGELRSDEEQIESFAITSVGDTVLTLSDVRIAAGDAFSVSSPTVSGLLEPGDTLTVDVVFRPLGAADEGTVRVSSDDPTRPEIDVGLLGSGAVPELRLTPETHDFDDVFVPCSDEVDVEMKNVGREDLVISDVSYRSGGMLSFDARGTTLPLTLGPDEGVRVGVRFDALADQRDEGVITVTSNDPRGSLTATQTAAGAYLGTATERFSEPGIPPVDILFLVDQSCSMEDANQDDIERGIPDFVAELREVSDWQLILVHQDDGCAIGGILDENTPDAVQLLVDNAFDPRFLEPFNTERLLKLADIALSKTTAGGCNDGFLRPGALLHILIASDEPEQSGQPAPHWIQRYAPRVASEELLRISSIIDLSGCQAGGAGYEEASDLTHGAKLDICSADWGSQMTDIATEVLAGVRTYNLANTTDASTIVVTVNGVATTDFVYSPVNSSVTVNSPPIGEGDIVEITYKIAGDCG